MLLDIISTDMTDAIAEPVMTAEDYRQMATSSFKGGLAGKIKTVSIAMKAIRAMNKSN